MRTLGLVIGLILMASLATPRASAATYVVEDLGSLGLGTEAVAINDRDQVVGLSFRIDGTFRAFVWSRQAGMRELAGPSTATRTSARGINDMGQVVGQHYPAGGEAQAVSWSNGVMTILPMPSSAVTPSSAVDINDSGVIVGTMGESFSVRALRWPPTLASPLNLGNVNPVGGSAAMAISDAGHVVGYAHGSPPRCQRVHVDTWASNPAGARTSCGRIPVGLRDCDRRQLVGPGRGHSGPSKATPCTRSAGRRAVATCRSERLQALSMTRHSASTTAGRSLGHPSSPARARSTAL